MEGKDLPIETKAIMAIWSFKGKRFPYGTLNNHKEPQCAHRCQQTWGQDYWDTYAPIVTWASGCLLLIVATNHGLQSKSIHFVLAFLRADLDFWSIWNFLQAPIQSIFLERIDIAMFSNIMKVQMG